VREHKSVPRDEYVRATHALGGGLGATLGVFLLAPRLWAGVRGARLSPESGGLFGETLISGGGALLLALAVWGPTTAVMTIGRRYMRLPGVSVSLVLGCVAGLPLALALGVGGLHAAAVVFLGLGYCVTVGGAFRVAAALERRV